MRAPTPFNISSYVLAHAAHTPDKIALAILSPSRSERWSYARLAEAVERAAGGLLATGLVPGDRLLLRLGNSSLFPVAFLGAIRAGIIPMPTSAALTVPEITRLADSLPPAAILASEGISVPQPSTDLAPQMGPCPVYGPEILDGPVGPLHPSQADDLAYIVFTSGSSGAPKPVAHAHRAVWARRMMWDGWYGLRSDDRLMHAGAMNWTYTLGTGLLDPWAIGATALVPAEGTDPASLPLLAKRHDATILAGSPGIFRKLLHAPLPAMPKLRHSLSAGEALPASLRARWQSATGTDIHEALGMSEVSTFLSGSPARPAPPQTTGFAQTGRRLRVLAPTGEVGPLAIHGSDPGLMLGYLSADGTVTLPLTDGWFETSDLVSHHPGGAFTYHGRADDILTAGGYRIAPLEIEAAFEATEHLTDCAALTIQPKPETTLLALAYCGGARETELTTAAQALAPYKRPRAFINLASLPRAGNGKLDRQALARLVQEMT